jgi:prepilin-type N-terminal cleavage/methylation domain-containing protein
MISIRSRKGVKGFTLLEILAATLLFSIGAAALMWAISTGMSASSDVENVDLALNIAQARLEYLKGIGYDAIAVAGDSAAAPNADFPDYSVAVNIAEGADPMQVEVTVTWQVKGEEAGLTLTTLVADI